MTPTASVRTTDPGSGVRGAAASGKDGSCVVGGGSVLAAAPRTSDGRFGMSDARLVRSLVEQPASRKALGPCSYCGASSSGGTCEAHDDLPDLDRGVFRDFCSALKAAGA